MPDRKEQIEMELGIYRDLSRAITDDFARSLMKEVVKDLQAELSQEQDSENSGTLGDRVPSKGHS